MVCSRLAGMKNRIAELAEKEKSVLLGVFGEARVVYQENNLYLEGGSMADRVEAKEWVATHLRRPLSVARPSCRKAS